MTGRDIYDRHRGPSDPPWEALPDIARRGWRVAATEASKTAPSVSPLPERIGGWRPPAAPTVPDHALPRTPGASRA